jgi:hypothetical protein
VLPPAGQPASVLTSLTPRPDTRRITWGSGEIVVPAETQAHLTGQQIDLDSGWLWGTGTGPDPWVIHTAGIVITLKGGQFALVNLPGQMAWFYLLEGNAEVYRAQTPDRTTNLAGPAMLALVATGELKAVPLDPIVMQAMAPGVVTSTQLVWEPSLAARLRDGVALLGIRTAQILTVMTYLSAIAALFAVPLLTAIWWSKRKPLSAGIRD